MRIDSLPDRLQPFTEGFRDEESEDEVPPAETPPALGDAGGNSEQESESEIHPPVVPERKRPNEIKPTSTHNSTHLSKDPTCET